MKKRILSFLLIAVSLLQLSAVTPFAEDANPAGEIIVADDSTSQNNGMSFAPGEKYVQEDYLFGDKDSTSLTMTLESTIYIPGDLLEVETPTHAGYIFSNRTNENYLTDHHISVCIQISSDKTYFYPRVYFGNAANKNSGFSYYTEAAGTKLPTDEQVHIAITMQHNEADNKVSIIFYVNGKKTTTRTSTLQCNNPAHTDGHKYTAEKFHIGGMVYGDSSSNIANSFKGYMKNFAIYNDVRTASEISSDYSDGCSTSDVNLISYYQMGSRMSGNYKIEDWSQNQNGLIFTGERDGISFDVNDRYEQKYVPEKLGTPEVSAMTIEQSIVIPSDAKKANGYILSNKRGKGTENYIDTAVTYKNGNWYPTLYLGNGDGTYINNYVFTGLAIPADREVFIAYTLDGSLTSKDVTAYIKYYNDSGKLTQKTETASMGLKSNYGFGNTETSTFMNNPFRVGSSSYGEWFTGEIVSVAMYGYAKTANQISSDYHNGLDTKDSALIAGYDFATDDKSDYVVDDKSAYNNDLIYTGSNTSLKNNSDEKYVQEASLADKGFTGSNALTMEAVIFIPADYDMSTNKELGFVMGNTQPGGWSGEHIGLRLACNDIWYNADGQSKHRGIYAYLKINDTIVTFKHTKYGIPTGKPAFISITIDATQTSKNISFSVRYFNDDGTLAEYTDTQPASMDLTQIDFGKSVSGNPFVFGVTNYGGRFVGDVSHASIYSDVRTSDELTADFLNGCDAGDENLISGYALHAYNQGSLVIKDKSKYQNDLSFTGANNSGLKFSEFEGYPLSKPLATTPKTLEFRYSSTKQMANVDFCANAIKNANKSQMSLSVQKSDNGGNLRLYFNDIITGKSYSIVFPDTKQYFNTGGEWYHLAVVIDDVAYTYRLYINGAEVSKVEADKDTFVNLDTLCHDLPLSIGNQGANGGNNSFFTGSMQDVVFYSDVRTPEEILLDYSKDYDPTDVNMIAMFNLNMSVEGVNGLVDNTGNGYDLRTDIWLDEDEVPELGDYAYSFAVVGDTQILSGHTNNWNNKYGALSRENINSLYKWILDNQEKYNIQHVFGVGDIVESYDAAKAINEWEKAKAAIEQMNGKISYTLVRGDSHDLSSYMNQYLGTEEYYSMFKPGESEFPTRDSEGNVKMDTGYRTFTVGEEKYLFLMLDCSPERELIEWGEKVIKAHPCHKVILTTHMYMTGNGELNTHGGNIWDAYKDEPNMFMVLCGHSANHDDNIVVRQDRGTNGNLVTTMMINPQYMDQYGKNVGCYGMVALLYFSRDGKTVSVRYTTTNGYDNTDEKNGNSTTPFVKYFKPENQFDIVVDDADRETSHNYKAVVTAPTCVNGGYTTYTCACGDSYVADETEATGVHTYDSDLDADCNICGEVREVSVTNGTCGTTATWRYEDGVLYIEGTGSMNAYSSKNMPWLEYKNEITTVIVAEGIRSIGKCSFYECVNLTSVTLPSTLRTINPYAFYGCSGLTEITLPASLTAIKQYAFRRSGLVSATFENDCGWYAGENKVAAAELSFENGAALHLVKYGFKADWTRDTKAEPEIYNLIAMGYCGTNAWWTLDNEGTLSILGSGVVINCTANNAPWTAYKNEITKVVISEGITKLGKSAFYEYANITEVVLPSTLTEIGHYAFYGCKGLTEVTIPASVTTIGSYVFRKSGVTSVIFESTEGWSYKGSAIDVTDAANVAYLMNKVSYSNVWSK